MGDELVEEMANLNLEEPPSMFDLMPVEIIQNIFDMYRESQKHLADRAVQFKQDYNTFMRNPVVPYRPGMSHEMREHLVFEAEHNFITDYQERHNMPIDDVKRLVQEHVVGRIPSIEQTHLPYKIALRYFRDLARRRGHNIN